MNLEDIEKLLIDVTCSLQEMSGREVVNLTSESSPLLDMPGFDSLNGVEATVDALSRLDLELDVINIFADDNKALTIREAAKRILASMPTNEGD
jgi:hypothetical protein